MGNGAATTVAAPAVAVVSFLPLAGRETVVDGVTTGDGAITILTICEQTAHGAMDSSYQVAE